MKEPDVRAEPPLRAFGLDEGVFEVPEDFDDPLPDDLVDLFYSGETPDVGRAEGAPTPSPTEERA